ncbi:DUF6274 family protein [Streptomyces sp. URMC 123]|uniref:DUF6274 family protein n=1 Tax=Streptomyces sp. URMC 123 TaxID=3423403 RepID=UPI003F1DF754
MVETAKHRTRALLRAHLSAASGYRHLTRHCPICHQLLRLAMEPGEAPAPSESPEPAAAVGAEGGAAATEPGSAPERVEVVCVAHGRESAQEGRRDESPPPR